MRKTNLLCVLAVSALAVCQPSAGQVEVIYTNLQEDDSSLIPGLDGERFRHPLAPFLTLEHSPSGNHWVFKGFTDNADSDANDVIMGGSLNSGSALALEGELIQGQKGISYGFFDSDAGVNDSGVYVVGNRLSGPSSDEDECLITLQSGNDPVISVLEGDPAAGLVDPPGVAGDELFGNSLNSVHILEDGTVCFRADQIQNVGSDYESALYQGSVPVLQEGTSAASIANGDEVFDSFVALSGNTFSNDVFGENWIVEADLAPSFDTTEAVIVNSEIVLREGDTVCENVSIDAIFAVDMLGNGDWMARGDDPNDDDWAVLNGNCIAKTGDPIVPGSEIAWGDSIKGIDGNSEASFIVVGNTSEDIDVIVLNGDRVIVSQGDPVDLNGNGEADDDVFVGPIASEDAFIDVDTNDDLVDDRKVYFFCELQDKSGEDIGDGFLCMSLAVPVKCSADLNGDNVVDTIDLLNLLGAWGACKGCPQDLNGDNIVDTIDLLALLGDWGDC